ncbi:MAG: Fur family transcriptional regulator, ferric uptake regulator [Frankiales bacterium]|jgi:Fur family ferric uptake transcriptional regulator|nr:Fur family transcriptional regulator, ferric uptake regulator [Frankiales bacterium]
MTSEAVTARGPGRVRNTRQANAINDLLHEQDGFRTANELFAALRQRGDKIGLTTVYRHLNLLATLGEADVVHTDDGESQFRLCGSGRDLSGLVSDHHHHVVCRTCGRSVEVSAPKVEAWAEQVAAAAGYTEVTHTLEVFGLCPDHAKPSGRAGAGSG